MNEHAQALRSMLALLPTAVNHVDRDTIHAAAVEIDRLDKALVDAKKDRDCWVFNANELQNGYNELDARLRKAPELTPDIIEIFGRPNFTCIRIANVLRKAGRTIANRSEDEQAATILFLYQHYLNNKPGWREAANAELKAIVAAAPQSEKQPA